MYIVEVSPARLRGRLGIMFQLAVCIGALLAVLADYFLAKHLSPHWSWRWMFASEMVPIVGFLIGLCFIPYSPRWLAKQGRYDEALAVLTRIEGPDVARAEIKRIKDAGTEQPGSFSDLLLPGMRRALAIGLLLAFFHNFSGWTGIALYLPTLFQKAGYAEVSDALFQSVFVFAATIFLTLIPIWLADRIGRRPLWNGTTLAKAAILVVAGLTFHFHATGIWVVVVVSLIAVPHAIGTAPLPWLMMSEIYPTRVRAKAVAITTAMVWVGAFTTPFVFPMVIAYSEQTIGSIAAVFWLYAFLCLLGFAFGLTMLPETKGKTLEEITEA
jgi:SP family arabinose:H+ symporter-like MFS transporter